MSVKKSCTAILLIALLSCLACPVVWAEPPTEGRAIIQPSWVTVNRIYPLLTFTGTTANCSAVIEGLSGTTKITATVILERKNNDGSYTEVTRWSNRSVSGQTLNFSDTYSVTSGYTYRLSVSAEVTRNGYTETVGSSMEAKLW